jgi:hypothetical protein
MRLGPRRRHAILLAWALTLPSLVACGSTQFDGRTYHGDGLAFRVGPVPSNWRSIEADAARLAFRDDAGRATIAVSGRCGKDGDDVPLEALTHHLFLHFTDRQIVNQRVLPLDGRDALRTELIAELDGVPKHYIVYVIKKDGCVYDLIRIADVASADQSQAEFERFVQGFAALDSA